MTKSSHSTQAPSRTHAGHHLGDSRCDRRSHDEGDEVLLRKGTSSMYINEVLFSRVLEQVSLCSSAREKQSKLAIKQNMTRNLNTIPIGGRKMMCVQPSQPQDSLLTHPPLHPSTQWASSPGNATTRASPPTSLPRLQPSTFGGCTSRGLTYAPRFSTSLPTKSPSTPSLTTLTMQRPRPSLYATLSSSLRLWHWNQQRSLRFWGTTSIPLSTGSS